MVTSAWVGGTLTKRLKYRTHLGLCPSVLYSHLWLGLSPPMPRLPHLFLKPSAFVTQRAKRSLKLNFRFVSFCGMVADLTWNGNRVCGLPRFPSQGANCSLINSMPFVQMPLHVIQYISPSLKHTWQNQEQWSYPWATKQLQNSTQKQLLLLFVQIFCTHTSVLSFPLPDLYTVKVCVVFLPQGMLFIHDSPLSFHGRLKSSNVLVDGRWTCKLSDMGMFRFRENEAQPEEDEPAYYYSEYSLPTTTVSIHCLLGLLWWVFTAQYYSEYSLPITTVSIHCLLGL